MSQSPGLEYQSRDNSIKIQKPENTTDRHHKAPPPRYSLRASSMRQRVEDTILYIVEHN